MVSWGATFRVDTPWDVNILRNVPQSVPDSPLDTTGDPATITFTPGSLYQL